MHINPPVVVTRMGLARALVGAGAGAGVLNPLYVYYNVY
jgi:hypothetical protein